MYWGKIFFVFILLGLSGASIICDLIPFPSLRPSVLEYFQPLSFPPFSPSSLSETLIAHVFNHLTLSYMSLTLYSVFLVFFLSLFVQLFSTDLSSISLILSSPVFSAIKFIYSALNFS